MTDKKDIEIDKNSSVHGEGLTLEEKNKIIEEHKKR